RVCCRRFRRSYAAGGGTASQERSFVYERKERHTAPPLAPGMSWIRREGAVSASAGDPVARAMPSECSRLPTPRPATDDSVTPGTLRRSFVATSQSRRDGGSMQRGFGAGIILIGRGPRGAGLYVTARDARHRDHTIRAPNNPSLTAVVRKLLAIRDATPGRDARSGPALRRAVPRNAFGDHVPHGHTGRLGLAAGDGI